MKRYTLCTLLSALLFVACQTDYTADLGLNGDGTTTLTITTAKTRTYLGAKEGDSYPVYWSEGDRIVVNGNLSEEAVIDNNDRCRIELPALYSLHGWFDRQRTFPE